MFATISACQAVKSWVPKPGYLHVTILATHLKLSLGITGIAQNFNRKSQAQVIKKKKKKSHRFKYIKCLLVQFSFNVKRFLYKMCLYGKFTFYILSH